MMLQSPLQWKEYVNGRRIWLRRKWKYPCLNKLNLKKGVWDLKLLKKNWQTYAACSDSKANTLACKIHATKPHQIQQHAIDFDLNCWQICKTSSTAAAAAATAAAAAAAASQLNIVQFHTMPSLLIEFATSNRGTSEKKCEMQWNKCYEIQFNGWILNFAVRHFEYVQTITVLPGASYAACIYDACMYRLYAVLGTNQCNVWTSWC